MKAAILALPLIALTMFAAPASAERYAYPLPSFQHPANKEMDRTVEAGVKRATEDACARSLTPGDQRGACPRDEAQEKVAALAVSASASAEEAKAAPRPAVTSRLLTTTPTADDER